MTVKWSQISETTEFNSLPAEKREKVRTGYFDKYIAPKVKQPEKLPEYRAAWDAKTLPKPGKTGQKSLIPEPKKAEGFSGAFKSGAQTTARALGSTGKTYFGDTEGVEQDFQKTQEQPRTEEQEAFTGALMERSEIADDTLWDGIKNVAVTAWENPTGAAHEAAAQVPNSAVVLSGGYAGFKGGAAIGAMTGPAAPVATPILAATGGILGMFLANAGIETGFIAQEKAADGEVTEEELGEAKRQGATKAGVITAVDAATIGFNRYLFGAPGRAVESTVAKTLSEKGVDLADGVAVRKALNNKDILAEVTQKAEVAFSEAMKKTPRAARTGTGLALETASEGTGEYLGSAAAGLDASFTEAAMESLLSIPQSAVDIKVSKKLDSPGMATVLSARTLGQHLSPESAGILQKTDLPPKARVQAAKDIAAAMKDETPAMSQAFMNHAMKRISQGRPLVDEGEQGFYDALSALERHKIDQEAKNTPQPMLGLPAPKDMTHAPIPAEDPTKPKPRKPVFGDGIDRPAPFSIRREEMNLPVITTRLKGAKDRLSEMMQSGSDPAEMKKAVRETRVWLDALELVRAGRIDEAEALLGEQERQAVKQFEEYEQSQNEVIASERDERRKVQLQRLSEELLSKKDGNNALVDDPNYIRGESDIGGVPQVRSSSVNPAWFQENSDMKSVDYVRKTVGKYVAGEKLGSNEQRVIDAMIEEADFRNGDEDVRAALDLENDAAFDSFLTPDESDMVADYPPQARALQALYDRAIAAGMQESEVDSIIESNPEMNDNELAGAIYAEIGSYKQNISKNNQGGGGENTGAQGEAGRAERTGQPAESRTDQETGQQEQHLNQEVADDRAGQSVTESNDGERSQPVADGVVQPGGTGTDTVGAGQEAGATGGTTDPAVTQDEQPSPTQGDPNVRQVPEPLDLTAEQDGTTPQPTDPNAETRAQVNRERDFFGLDTPEGNTSNVGMGGRQDDMVGVTANESDGNMPAMAENERGDRSSTTPQPQERSEADYDYDFVLTHESSDPDFDGVITNKGNVFDGIFALEGEAGAALGPGGYNHSYVLRKDKVAGHGDSDLDYDRSIKFLKNRFPSASDEQIDMLYVAAVEDEEYSQMFDEEELYQFRQNGEPHPLEEFLPGDLGEASWELQNIRGQIAVDQGFDAIAMEDENGTSYFIPFGSKAKKINPNQSPRTEGAGTNETDQQPARRDDTQRNIYQDRIDDIDDPVELRAYVNDLRADVMTDERTGLGSNRAWIQREPKAYTASVDLDSLKWVNDNVGHAAGDRMIELAGEALGRAGFKGDAFHVSGDEFYVQANSAEKLNAGLKIARDWLGNQTVGEGDNAVSPGFSYGIGQDLATAEQELNNDKARREETGERAARGERPGGPVVGRGQDRGPGEAETDGQATAKDRQGEGAERSESAIEGEIDAAANEAATSSTNDTPAPTDDQKAAGNYKKGHFSWNGLNITIENPKDSTRSGTDDNGNAWSNTMQAHYGYLKRTEGADGEHVDVFFGPNEDSEKVYVIDQRRDKGNRGLFDEHKIMLGFKNKMDAVNAYKGSYQKGWGVAKTSTLTIDELQSWLAEGDLKKPYSEKPGQPADSTTTKGASLADTDDVGGEMSFNRRQKGFSLQDIREADNDTERVAMAVKSKVWERPDYQGMVDSGVQPIMAHLVKQIYDSIPTKPKHTADKYIYAYVEGVEAAREVVNEFLADKKAQVNMALAVAKLVSGYQESFSSPVDISSLTSSDTTGALSWFMERLFPKNENGKRWGRENEAGNDRGNAMGNKFISQIQIGISDLIKAVEAVSDGFPAKQEAWQRSYEIVEKDGSFGIKGKNRYRILESFETREEAVTRAREMTSRKKKDAFKEPATSPQHSTRHGVDRRDGKNVSTAEMKEAFGFSKINFGNWMKGKSGDKERQAHINSAYDAFYDLSEILGLPPKAMSLNGTLSIAFGAQGKGGRAAAHFVPGLNEINLTRNTGAGSLAHEWAHALDHYFGVQAGMAKKDEPFLSAFPIATSSQSEIRPEIVEAFNAIDRAMNKKTTTQTPEEVEKLRQLQVEKSKRYLDSWLKGLVEEVKGKDINDAVLAFGKAIERLESGNVGEKVRLGKSRNYVNEATSELREAYKAVTGQYFEMNRAQQISLNSDSLSVVIDAEKFAENHDPQRVVSKDYKKNAKSKESASGKPYWSTPPEMLARAFEVYVVDKLAENEARNDYLTAAWKNVSSEADAAELDMAAQEALIRHPSGEERQTINLAFDVLMDTIETKETESGVALFRVTPNAGGGVRLQDAIWKVRSITSEWTVFADRSTHVVATFADLPADVQKAARDGGGDEKVKGVFHRDSGDVYVVAENHTSERDVEETLFHEAYGHMGLAGLMGPEITKKLNDLFMAIGGAGALNDIARRNNINLGHYAREFGKRVQDKRMSRAARNAAMVDELLAHMAEDSRPTIQRRVKEILGAIRQWLKQNGFRFLGDVTENELFYLMKLSREHVQRSTHPTVSFVADGSSMFRRAGRSGSDRTAWNDFPSVVFQADLGAAKKAAGYEKAKSGDVVAAAGVVKSLLNNEAIENIRKELNGRQPIVVPVLAEESTGANMLPLAYAYALGGRLGLPVDASVIQSVRAGHTDSGAFHRIASQPVFDGNIEPGKDYLIVDDTMTMGGTLANLRGHIEANGGNVILASTLTGFESAAKIGISEKMKKSLLEKHGDKLNDYLVEEFGFGIDSLTQGEAGHLRATPSLDEIRARISEAQDAAGIGKTGQDQLLENPPARLRQDGYPFTLSGNNPSDTSKTGLEAQAILARNWSGIASESVAGAIREAYATANRDVVDWLKTNENRVKDDAMPGGMMRTADEEVFEKIGLGKKEAVSLADKVRALKGESWNKAMKAFGNASYERALDGLIGIRWAEDAVGKGIAAGDYAGSGYVGVRLATGVADVMHAVMHRGAPEWRDGVLAHREGTEGLLEVFSELGQDLDNWLGWMAGNRAEELMATGRENNLTQDDVDSLKALSEGKEELFNRIKDKYGQLNKAMLDVAQEAGLINPASRAEWESEWYVPFYRRSEADGNLALLAPRTKRGLSHQTAGIKKLKGGEAATNDLLENILTNWMKMVDASMKNSALVKTVDNLADSDYISDESVRWQQVVVSKSEIAKRIKSDRKTMAAVADFLGLDAGAPLDQVANELEKVDSEGFEKLWGPVAPTDPDVIRIQRNGKNEYYRVNDKPLLRAITHLGNDGFNDPVTRGARFFKRLLTTGVTSSPDFILRNFVRDAAHAWAINPDGFKFGVDSMKGLKGALSQDADYWIPMFAGASFQGGYVHGTDPEASAQIMRRALEARGLTRNEADAHALTVVNSPEKMKGMLKMAWQKYRQLGDKVENANRLSTYRAAAASGKGLAQAVFESKDLMDYSLRGNFQAVVWLTDVVPFLNARLQGLSKLGRAGKANPVEVGMALGKIAMFSVALAMLNDDDEKYQGLPDWEKDAYWHIFLGEEHFRIPKPFEIGIIGGTIPERIYHTWVADNQPDEKLLMALKHGVFDTLGFNPLPQALLPVIEVWGNRSFFFDTPIEGMSDRNRLPEDRYNAYTSTSMVQIGQVLGVSPKKLQHLWEGYTGTMGAYALSTADMMTRAVRTGDAPRPEWSVSDLPVAKSFYRGAAPARSTQYATDLYDRLEEVNQIYSSIRDKMEWDPEAANKMLEDNKDKIAYRKTLNTVSKRLSKLRNQKSMIMNDPKMSPRAKRDMLNGINAQINKLTKMASETTQEAF